MINGVATKNADPVVCSPYLSAPVRVDDEVTGSRKFALVSGICHSGTLTSGHYSAFVRDNVCGVWLHCNDKAVTRTTLEAVFFCFFQMLLFILKVFSHLDICCSWFEGILRLAFIAVTC